jgi:hypothetical protein
MGLSGFPCAPDSNGNPRLLFLYKLCCGKLDLRKALQQLTT